MRECAASTLVPPALGAVLQSVTDRQRGRRVRVAWISRAARSGRIARSCWPALGRSAFLGWRMNADDAGAGRGRPRRAGVRRRSCGDARSRLLAGVRRARRMQVARQHSPGALRRAASSSRARSSASRSADGASDARGEAALGSRRLVGRAWTVARRSCVRRAQLAVAVGARRHARPEPGGGTVPTGGRWALQAFGREVLRCGRSRIGAGAASSRDRVGPRRRSGRSSGPAGRRSAVAGARAREGRSVEPRCRADHDSVSGGGYPAVGSRP